MARAEAAESVCARICRCPGFKAAAAGVSGHAGSRPPAYQKLLAAEPFLRRLIPVLIVIFLVDRRAGPLRRALPDEECEREHDAREMITMIASVLAPLARRNRARQAPRVLTSSTRSPTRCRRARPSDGRRIYVTDPDGLVVATAPRDGSTTRAPLTAILGEAQPLTIFGARAGVLEIALADETRALATVHHLDGRSARRGDPADGRVLDDWRADVSLNVTIFIGTSAILLVILYGYFAQAARAAGGRPHLLAETQAALRDGAVRGRCGLWDWDLARGRMFWSRSMFEMLGLEPRDDLLGFGEVAAHPSRRRRPDGARRDRSSSGERPSTACSACATPTGAGSGCAPAPNSSTATAGEPHLIGIAVDVTEQMRCSSAPRPPTCGCATRSRPSRGLRAVGRRQPAGDVQLEIPAAARLPDRAVAPGTPYAEVMAAGRKPLVRAQVVIGGPPEEGARTLRAQLEDGRWLQINERRTKDGGFVSVGTDITQLKRTRRSWSTASGG
jgi:two-component system, cell cycle sensor histidine kinase PleC